MFSDNDSSFFVDYIAMLSSSNDQIRCLFYMPLLGSNVEGTCIAYSMAVIIYVNLD